MVFFTGFYKSQVVQDCFHWLYQHKKALPFSQTKHISRETTGTLWLYLPNQDLRKILRLYLVSKNGVLRFFWVWRKCLIPIPPKTHVVLNNDTCCLPATQFMRVNNSTIPIPIDFSIILWSPHLVGGFNPKKIMLGKNVGSFSSTYKVGWPITLINGL